MIWDKAVPFDKEELWLNLSLSYTSFIFKVFIYFLEALLVSAGKGSSLVEYSEIILTLLASCEFNQIMGGGGQSPPPTDLPPARALFSRARPLFSRASEAR